MIALTKEFNEKCNKNYTVKDIYKIIEQSFNLRKFLPTQLEEKKFQLSIE